MTLQSVDGPHLIRRRPLKKKKTILRKRNSASRQPLGLSYNMDSSLGFQPALPPCRFGACQTSQSLSWFLKINLPLYTHTQPLHHTHTLQHIYEHTLHLYHIHHHTLIFHLSHTHPPHTVYHTHMLSITHTHIPLLVCFSSEPSLLTQWLI